MSHSIREFNSPSLISDYTLIRNDHPDGRYYSLPNSSKKLYSVTTVLSKTSDKSGLTEWRKRVGEHEASRISKEATTIGTRLHSLMETLLENKWAEVKEDPELLFRFQKVKSFLEDDIKELMGSELPLYSETLGIAGTTDLVYRDTQDRIVVADLKTSRTAKKREYIEDYFLQLTAYAVCLYERFKVDCELGLILVVIPDGSTNKFYVDPSAYMETFQSRVQQFFTMNHPQE